LAFAQLSVGCRVEAQLFTDIHAEVHDGVLDLLAAGTPLLLQA